MFVIREGPRVFIDHIVIVTNRNKPAIEAYFESSDEVLAKSCVTREKVQA